MVVRKIAKRKFKENYWGIGTPIGSNRNPLLSNKPINFFKTRKQDYLVNMFGDMDRDGVMNAFDCKPLDPNREGLLDAIAGAVKGVFSKEKGSIKKGWSEGMAKPGVFGKSGYKQRQLQKATEEYHANQPKTDKQISKRQAKAIVKRTGGVEQMEQKQRERFASMVSKAKGVGSYVYKAIPGLSETMSPKKTVESKVETKWVIDPKTGKQIAVAWKLKKKQVPTSWSERVEMMRRKVQRGQLSPVEKRQSGAVKSMARMVFPIIPAGATSGSFQYQSRKGQMGGRGRPRQSYDPRYAAYGGVIAYRRAMVERRKAMRAQMKQQEEMMKMQRKARIPQYEAQQYTQQVPQEVEGATPDYSQFPGYEETPEMQMQQPVQLTQEQIRDMQMARQAQMAQQQMPQQMQAPQQMPVPFSQRPVGKVLMESQGKPYPAVERTPLQPPRQTIPYGYVEDVDSFTGRRFMRKLPDPEKWSGGGS
jgi:hypothetical protein